MTEEENNTDNVIPEFGTKEFNEMCFYFFGGKPKTKHP